MKPDNISVTYQGVTVYCEGEMVDPHTIGVQYMISKGTAMHVGSFIEWHRWTNPLSWVRTACMEGAVVDYREGRTVNLEIYTALQGLREHISELT